ncbi:kinesin-like protein NACK1-like, partial [Trifolium pratense]
FAPACSTQKVYDEGAKDVALSALSGINATIFAYGQTSSGKTFTMRGITENAIRDIYDYIKNVVSEKTRVRELQNEVARLEGELRKPELSADECLRSLLDEKELKIQQMEKDMEDLKRQRDLAQCQLDLERRANKVQKGSIDCGSSSQVVRCLSFADENELDIVKHTPERRVTVSRQAMLKNLLASPDPSILVDEIQKLEH